MLEAQPCRTCSLKAIDQNGNSFCQLTRTAIDLNNDFCSKHQTTLAQCEVCHQYMADLPIIVYTDETQTEFKLCCQNCSKLS